MAACPNKRAAATAAAAQVAHIADGLAQGICLHCMILEKHLAIYWDIPLNVNVCFSSVMIEAAELSSSQVVSKLAELGREEYVQTHSRKT